MGLKVIVRVRAGDGGLADAPELTPPSAAPPPTLGVLAGATSRRRRRSELRRCRPDEGKKS